MRGVLAAAVLTVGLSAQAATNQTYGQSCWPPTLIPVWNWMPVVGGVMHTQVTRLQPTASCVYMGLGLTPLSPPVDLIGYGMPGCLAYFPVAFIDAVSFFGSVGNYFLVIPNDPNLIGVHLYQQALVIDPAAPTPAGAVTTNPLLGVIGND